MVYIGIELHKDAMSLVDHVTWYTLVLNYIRMPCPLYTT
jgi:hypothetical protein